jgi:endoglycosylceramidase
MAQYGFNCVRLLFSWSKLEPQKGIYNQAYIDEIKHAIEIAAKYNIYILLDMHQDAYGKYIATPSNTTCDKPNNGWDGAPDWATLTDSASTCTADGSRESAPAVIHAWQYFWDNKNGIQDACVNAWSALVKQTAKYTNVVGYDLLNEPSLGYQEINIQADKLSKFYGNLIKHIRMAENEVNAYQHIAFFEMSVTWNGQGIPFIPFPNFTNDNNIIFAPHTYFESITYLFTVEQGYDLLKNLSGLFGTNLFIGEYGFFNNPTSDVLKLKRFAKKEDDNFAGSTIWQWAQAPGDPHGISWDGTRYNNTSLHLIELDKNGIFTGNKNELFLNVLSRSRPIAICGKPTRLISNPDNGTMELSAKANQEGTTTLWIPDRFGEPNITGNNVKSSDIQKVEGGFNVAIEVVGEYVINVTF